MNVGDDLLQEIEALSVQVDALDAAAVAFATPYADPDATVAVTVKRDRLLTEMDVVGILAGEHLERLRALSLVNLTAYAEAAAALRHYYATADYARYVRKPAPAKVIDGAVSLDWFRRSSGHVPPKFNAFEWLAVCDGVFQGSRRPMYATTWTKLAGEMQAFHFRGELNAPRLYRVVPG